MPPPAPTTAIGLAPSSRTMPRSCTTQPAMNAADAMLPARRELAERRPHRLEHEQWDDGQGRERCPDEPDRGEMRVPAEKHVPRVGDARLGVAVDAPVAQHQQPAQHGVHDEAHGEQDPRRQRDRSPWRLLLRPTGERRCAYGCSVVTDERGRRRRQIGPDRRVVERPRDLGAATCRKDDESVAADDGQRSESAEEDQERRHGAGSSELSRFAEARR